MIGKYQIKYIDVNNVEQEIFLEWDFDPGREVVNESIVNALGYMPETVTLYNNLTEQE
jgi:hypothetical protein